MPIFGVTDEQSRWPRLGVLRKGAPKPEKGNAPGRDLGEKFRFDPVDGDVGQAWLDAFGALEVETLTVKLPYPTYEEAWLAWREYRAAGGVR